MSGDGEVSAGQAGGGRFDAVSRRAMPDGAGVLRLHLLRHGQVAGFARREVRGHRDVPLSSEGARQHAALAAWLASHEPAPDRVLSSDLSRCADLADRVAAATGTPVDTDPRLREQHMGSWEGRTWADLSAEQGPLVNAWWDDYARVRPPGGETLEEAGRRVDGLLDELLADPVVAAGGERRVVLATHSGVVRLILCRALGLPADQALRFAPAAASHTSLLWAPAGAVVQSLGERPWLEPAGSASGRLAGDRPRLALSGSAGTGKTTLGRRLAESLGVPFLEEGMRRRLESGLVLSALDHGQLRALILELWEEQRVAEAACSDGFVADRSAADFAAFWIHYGFHHDGPETERRLAGWFAHLERYDRIVLLPWGALPLHDDGVRSPNRWLQYLVQALIERLLRDHGRPGQVQALPADLADLEQRLRAVLQPLGRG